MKPVYTSVRVRPGVVLVGLLALALNLRTALAGYPPLIDAVRADLGFSAGAAGFVQTGGGPLVAGSLLAGFGIGVAGVLLTGVVKEHLAAHAGAVTGGYVVAMMIPSTVARGGGGPPPLGGGGGGAPPGPAGA